MLTFGIQIAETGKIHDFKRISYLWNDILKMVDRGDSFESIMEYYKPLKNTNQTTFRLLAKKE